MAISAVLALLVGAAQDKEDVCGAADILCPKKGECKAKCREICDQVGEAYAAVRTRTVELMQKQYGVKCPCTAGECKADGCDNCATVKDKVFVPILKEKVSKRFKEWNKKVVHEVEKDGKTAKVDCTFLKKTCDPCIEEMAKASLKKLGDLFGKKKDKK